MALFALFILGCARAPDQELKAARVLLDSALAAQADKYAAKDFKTAEESLDGAIAEIDKKDYKKAKMMLVSATTAAYNAKMKAAEGKKQAASEADTAIMRANTLLTELKGLIEKAPKGKTGTEALKNDAAAAEAMLGKAQSAKSSGDYINARDRANACIASLKNALAAAKATMPVKRKKK